MQEQGISAADEWDKHDETATHFLVLNNSGRSVGCARLLMEYQPHPIFHIGRVAVLAPYRAHGIGSALMRYILQHCKSTAPHTPIYLHAQTSRQAFYERLSFIASGSEFMDAGIPHLTMQYPNP